MSTDFLSSFGFREDPFASTNAANEPLIGRYFVDPPFFPAVAGDPNSPKSNVVFAPRGGGKTALIEQRSSEARNFLCISYDRFPTDQIASEKDATANYHLTNISRILLLAVLTEIELETVKPDALDELDRKLLVGLSRSLLGGMSSERFKESLSGLHPVSKTPS